MDKEYNVEDVYTLVLIYGFVGWYSLFLGVSVPCANHGKIILRFCFSLAWTRYRHSVWKKHYTKAALIFQAFTPHISLLIQIALGFHSLCWSLLHNMSLHFLAHQLSRTQLACIRKIPSPPVGWLASVSEKPSHDDINLIREFVTHRLYLSWPNNQGFVQDRYKDPAVRWPANFSSCLAPLHKRHVFNPSF